MKAEPNKINNKIGANFLIVDLSIMINAINGAKRAAHKGLLSIRKKSENKIKFDSNLSFLDKFKNFKTLGIKTKNKIDNPIDSDDIPMIQFAIMFEVNRRIMNKLTRNINLLFFPT